jgi:hypothetical protein
MAEQEHVGKAASEPPNVMGLDVAGIGKKGCRNACDGTEGNVGNA